MGYNPTPHRRRSLRLKNYDYSRAGAYFITICTKNRVCRFGNISDRQMNLNWIGRILQEEWMNIPKRFPRVRLDEFVVMPNHVHGLIFIQGGITSDASNKANEKTILTVGGIVGAYKSLCTNRLLQRVRCRGSGRIIGTIWQRNYWERVVRNEIELDQIRKYIQTNPARWEEDGLFSADIMEI